MKEEAQLQLKHHAQELAACHKAELEQEHSIRGHLVLTVTTLEGEKRKDEEALASMQSQISEMEQQLSATRDKASELQGMLDDHGYITVLNEEKEKRLQLENVLAFKERDLLVEENAKLAGHQNSRQKIRHLQSLKEEIVKLKQDGAGLKLALAKAYAMLQENGLELPPSLSMKRSSRPVLRAKDQNQNALNIPNSQFEAKSKGKPTISQWAR